MRIFKRAIGLRKPKIKIKSKDLKINKKSKPGFGKKRELKKSVKRIREGVVLDIWPEYGQVKSKIVGKKFKIIKNRYTEVYYGFLKKDPIHHLIKTKNQKPKILILGPGSGQDIFYLNQELNKNKIKPKIDVLGLQKTIEPFLLEKKIVNKDFSSNLALEEISQDPKRNKKIISNLKGRYDLVVGATSVGLHTLYPAFNVFNVSMMLKKGGVAYVEIPTKKTINNSSNFGIPENHRKRMINQLDRLPQIVTKFLEAQAGKRIAQEFRFTNIDSFLPSTITDDIKKIDDFHIRYIKIERK